MHDAGRRMATGAAWMLLAKGLERSLGLVSMIVLARLLVPADFGLVAMATSIIALLEVLGAFNFDVALIQKREITAAHLDTAWTLNLLLRGLISLLCCGLAIPAAHFYGEPRVEAIMYVLAGGMFLGAFENIGTVHFRRDLTFDKEFVLQIGRKAPGVAVTLALALAFRNYWALVIGTVFGTLLGVVLGRAMHPHRSRLTLVAWRELLGFSGWMFLTNLLAAASQRAPDLVIGRMLGARSLGVYNLSMEFGVLPTTEIASPINRVVLPGYGRLAADRSALRDGFLAVMSMIALLGIPAACGIAAVADSLVRTLLGTNWLDCIPLLQILACYGLVTVLQTNFGYVFIALGRPHWVTMLAFLHATLQITLIFIGARSFGLPGAAAGALIAVCLALPVAFGMVMRLLSISPIPYLALLVRPACAAGVMFFSVRQYGAWIEGLAPTIAPVVVLLTSVVGGIVVYACVLMFVWRLAGKPLGAESRLIAEAARRFPRIALLWQRTFGGARA